MVITPYCNKHTLSKDVLREWVAGGGRFRVYNLEV
jgi:hypothetical protein